MFDLNPDPKAPPDPPAPPPPDTLDADLQAFDAGELPGGDPAAPPAGVEGAPAGDLLDEATIRMFLQVPFDFIAARKGEHWKLSPEELAALAPVAVKVSNKYAPELMKRWADELALSVILGMIFLKRVNLDTKKAAKETASPPIPAPVAV